MAEKLSVAALVNRASGPGPLKTIQSGPEMNAEDFAAACRRLVPKALHTLVRIMDNEDASPNARTAAAVTIIERAHGKASQQINTTHTDMTALHLAALREVASAAQHNAIDVTPLPSNPFQVTDKTDDPT